MLSTFLPWIVQRIVSPFSLQGAVGLAFALSLFSLWKKRFLLEWVTSFFFLVNFVGIVCCNSDLFSQYISLASSVSFALAAWASLLFSHPFTLDYAKLQVEEKKWESPLFLKVNIIMTMVFGAIFSLDVLLKVVKIYHPNLLNYSAFSMMSMVATILVIKGLPKWFRYKYSKGGVCEN